MPARRWWPAAAVGTLLVVATTVPVAAQLRTYGVGRPPTADEVKAWDRTIPADGEGLPPGSGTAVQGQPIFLVRCTACHGEKGENGKYDRLGGGRGSLATDNPVLTVGSFWQYAPTLWSYISRSQPVDEPGSLTADQVYAVTAYLLHVNGIIGEHNILDARSLPQIRMPNRNGFVPDARPDVGKTAKPRSRAPGRIR